jgi:hypothetical protein
MSSLRTDPRPVGHVSPSLCGTGLPPAVLMRSGHWTGRAAPLLGGPALPDSSDVQEPEQLACAAFQERFMMDRGN